ncbi:MAG: helix-turn-helix domain-containing protein [Deltaproteobacteria bacterium]|nr:helix-turn-helix domain-containing protein [Deltaproteobacteria bacterium]
MEYKIAIAKQLSSLLKNLRKQVGLTQMDLGERLGLSQRMVAKIEANPEKVSFERILQILNELDTDLVIRERNVKPVKDHSPDGESW